MRKTLTITIADEGRDKGKTYLLTELPAYQAEKWALRALSAISRNGEELPEHVLMGGAQTLAAFGFGLLLRLPFAEAEPLLDEMMGCFQIKPNPGDPNIVRGLAPGDIEEVATLLKLRKALVELHVGFTEAASPLTSDLAANA